MGFIKNFNNTVVLTSKNPEAFLQYTYDGAPGEDFWIIPNTTYAELPAPGTLYVNGLDIRSYDPLNPTPEFCVHLNATLDPACFHIYNPLNYNFDQILRFDIYDVSDFSSYQEQGVINVLNRPYIIEKGNINTYPIDDALIDDEASYMLIRSNPKFTGNITLNVDTSENMYLDTFKISDILSNKKYRKQQVSANSILSSDIRRTFSSLPLGELYRVSDENTLNISIPKTNLSDQYDTTYNYGAKLLEDELYAEDNGILAPLWINSKLPDYFAAFRLSGVYNPETYTTDSLSNLVFKYLEDSNIIRSWSMKSEAPLGKYLTTHLNDVVKLQAPVFLSLTDPAQIESDPNTWYGMAVDKGVMTGRSETTYFFNQAADNFTDLNAFVSQGFERNNLLCPNLINMNFIFSDEDVSLYSMNRYFGLYLTENILYKIAYYAENESSPVSILSMDGKDSSLFLNSEIFNVDGTIADEFKTRLFVVNDDVQLKRFTNNAQVDGTTFNEYVNKPNQNIFSSPVIKNNGNPFISFTLNTALEQGEHLRIINKTSNTIWEVYGIDASSYKCVPNCSVTDSSNGRPIVYRTFFNVNGDIQFQLREIEKAFERFTKYETSQFYVGIRGNDWLSLILNENANFDDRWVFQRITASTLNDLNDSLSGFNNAALASDITFFGRFTPILSDLLTIEYDSTYGPIDFEFFGNRQSISVSFLNRGLNNFYSVAAINNILDKFETPTLYQNLAGWYKSIVNFKVGVNTYQYVQDPFSLEDNVLIMTSDEILLLRDLFNAYNIYPVNISLMGINQVKDIDFTVNDPVLGVTNEYSYSRQNDISTYSMFVGADSSVAMTVKGSFVISQGDGIAYQKDYYTGYSAGSLMNTFDASLILAATTPTFITYAVLDGSYNYDVSNGNSDVSLGNYYDSSSLLKHGLIVPLISKWVGLGNDARNNPLRLFVNGSTNFIPTTTAYNQEISYPSFKYLSPGGRSWEDYIFYDVNDVIEDGSTYSTIKEAMLANPYNDYFSKLIYTNYNIESTKSRSSICYYNAYKNSIDVILLGLSLSIRVESIASTGIDIKNYNRFKFSFISTPSKNKNSNRPIDFIVNENTKTILMVWYQGNDELNYSMRYSSFLPGKGLLDGDDYGFITGKGTPPEYSFVKTPFIVNNSTIQKTLESVYGMPSSYFTSMTRPYAQFNNNLNLFKSTFHAFGENTIIGDVFLLDNTRSFETFAQYIDYEYKQNANTFGDYVVNSGYKYNENTNMYVNNTTNYNTLQYLLQTSRSYIMYYILRGDEIITSLSFGSVVNPLSVSINQPRTYASMTTYNGWFKPKFNNILEFKSNENAALINTVEKDFTFSNTNLRAYNNIPQLWYNKVVTTVSGTDVSAGNAISFVPNYNVFKSQWDANYYTKDNLLVNGYESANELSSFFGSKLPKLPNDITLEKWDITTASYTSTNSNILISLNISRAILSLFKTNSMFISNWASFNNSNIAISNYIKTTILGYYNISQPKIVLKYYIKPFDGTLLHLVNDSDFALSKQNFNGQLSYVNNEYLYNIDIPKSGNFSYFASLTLTEK